MHILEPFLVGLSLSMDAFAVSIALAAMNRGQSQQQKLLAASALFGLFQALMPLLGWKGGIFMHHLARTLGPILASSILAVIGLKMLFDAFRPPSGVHTEKPLEYTRILLLAVATSIDALFVGVSYGCIGYGRMLFDATLYGLITFGMALAGKAIGRLFGKIFGNRCGILVGLVLIGIAIKVFLTK